MILSDCGDLKLKLHAPDEPNIKKINLENNFHQGKISLFKKKVYILYAIFDWFYIYHYVPCNTQ
jgi:hypothetical protein